MSINSFTKAVMQSPQWRNIGTISSLSLHSDDTKLGWQNWGGRIGCAWARAGGRPAGHGATAMRRRRALLAFVCALGAVQGRPFACGQCPAAFARRFYLDIHMRTHTGERPYQCDACLKRFTQKSSLNIHKRTHTGGCQPWAGLAARPPR